MTIAVERPLIGRVNLKDENRLDDTESCWPEQAFERIFLENYSRVAAVISRLVGDRARAEDLAIEAFWKLYRRPQVREENGNPGGWLYRTATHLGIDSLRAEARRGRYEKEAGMLNNLPAQPDPLDGVLRDERQAQVRRTLAALRQEQAQLLILRASGFSYQELAAILGVKPGSIGTMLIRAEAEFRKHYLEMQGR